MSIITSHNVTLSGKKNEFSIILRPLCDDHLSFLYKWNSDPEVLYWTEGGEDIELSYDKETVQFIYGSVSQNAFCFLVEVNENPIGECWLQKMNLPDVVEMYPGLDVRRIDMAIGEKEFWGKGIGSEFVRMLIEFAFLNQNVDVLHCFSEDYNKRSQGVWLKNGFKLVRTDELKQPQKGTNQYHFALSREEFITSSK